MKLVVDTNVHVSGIFWRGPPHRLLSHARAGRITFVASPALLAELAGVLGRAQFAGLMHRADTSVEALMANIQVGMEMAYPAPLAAPCQATHILAG